MNPCIKRSRSRLAVATVSTLLTLTAMGQETPAPSPAPKPDSDVVVLSPFVVTTEKDQGYYAENTLAGSRMRTNVADLASSITVVTLQEIEDTASVDINDVFRYEANTEGSGSYTPSVQSLRNDGVVDVNAGYTHGGDGQPQTNAIANRVRGIGIPSSSQNYYPTISQVPFDAYNIQSIEISRGPNSMLFGMGSPAGIVNQTNAQAVLNRNTSSITFRGDDRGSFRTSLSLNRGIIDDKLAIYFATVYDDRQFERKPSFDVTKRAYGALTFQPFKKTVIRASAETYDNRNRRPNTLTPRDTVTQWRTGGGWAFDASTGMLRSTVTGEVKGPIAMRTGSPRIADTRAYIMGLPGYDASLWNSAQTQYNGINIYGLGSGTLDNPNSVFYAPGLVAGNGSRPKMQIQDGQVMNWSYWSPGPYTQTFGSPAYPTTAAIYANPAWDAAYNVAYTESGFWTATGNGIGSYRYPGVSDKSIYDWEKTNILQMNFGHDTNTTFNVELEQEILPDLNLSAGWFRQDFYSTTNYTVSQLNVATLYVDTNLKLPDGRPNPYFGQPYVYDFDPDQFINTQTNDNYRVMLAWTPDFTHNSGWTKWLGSHQVLGLWSRNKVDGTFIRRRWFEIEDDQIENHTILWASDPTTAGWNRQRRSTQRLYYLGNPGDQPYGTVTRASGTFDNQTYNGRMEYYDFTNSDWRTIGTTMGFFDMSASTGGTQRQVDSKSFGITSNFWKDRLITTFGVRKDEYKARSTTTGAILDGPGGNQIEPGLSNAEQFQDGYFRTDFVLNRWNYWDTEEGTTRTTGAVFRPFRNWARLESRVAEGSIFAEFISSLGFSYNKSDNFNPPPAAQVDAFGNQLPKPTGEGEDYGVQFSLFQNKLFARINWFKATNENERTNPGTSISRLTLNVDTTLFRNWARTIALINLQASHPGDMRYNPLDNTNFGTGLSTAEEQAVEDAAAVIWKQPYHYYDDVGSIYATRSAEAKGMEVQVTYNPNRNWTMKLTAAKQETKYANVLKEFDAWYDVRHPVWAAAKGADYLLPQYQSLVTYTQDNGREVNLTNFLTSYGFNSNVYLGDQFGNENVQLYYDSVVTPQYAVARDLEGQAAPGQRKYRWSFLTSYTFDQGPLKGFSFGGNVRWEDRSVIGYYGRVNPGSGSTDLTLSDTTRPIYDDANYYTDLMVAYTTKVFRDKVRMRIQLNIFNALENGGLQVVGVNYDGSPNAYRIVDPRQFVLQTKFDF